MDTDVAQSDYSFAALRTLTWQNKGLFSLCVLTRSLAQLCIALLPYFLAKLVEEPSSAADEEQTFAFILLILLCSALFLVFWFTADFLHGYKVIPVINNFKQMAYTTMWGKEYETFIQKPSSKIASYVNQLRKRTYELWWLFLWQIVPLALTLPTYLIILFTTARHNTLLYLVFIALTVMISSLMVKPMAAAQRQLTDAESSQDGKVYDSFANFVNVFSFRAHRKEIGQHASEIDALTSVEVKAMRKKINYWLVASSLLRMGLWTIILFYSWHLYTSNQIPFQAFVVSTTVLIGFTAQYFILMQSVAEANTQTSAFREAYNYLFPGENIVRNYNQVAKEVHQPSDSRTFSEAVTLQNVSFAYPDDRKQGVLHNLDLTINKNEKIGIVGRSGSGKSTLIKILLGFYEPTEGALLVDDEAITSEQLARLYAYVPQDTTLFQASFFYNIAYAQQGNVTAQQVEAAATKAHIHDFIMSTPQGYETAVGERGITLSLGQRQRIAIARALLRRTDLLILDEATSALDSETERLVQASFEDLWANQTVVAIAHRLSTLNNVDRIIVLDNGRIVEQGTKEYLLSLNGHFADLWNHQREGMLAA